MASPLPASRLDPERREWLGRLYEAHQAAVFRLCLRLLRDSQEAADACHEVFIRAANTADSRALSENARGWLLTVARNHSLDLLRRRKRFGKALTTMGGGLDTIGDPEAAAINHDTLGSVLENLTPRERLALWQSAVEHRSLADIAGALKLNYMATAQMLSRARRHAATLAARVATVVGIPALYRVLRPSRGAGAPSFTIQAAQIAAIAAVPVLAIAAVSSAGAGQQRSPAAPVSTSAASPSAGASAAGSTGVNASGLGNGLATPSLNPALPAISPPIQVPASPVAVPSAIGSATNGVTKILPSINPSLPPLPSAAPLPTPTLPPVPHLPG